MFRSSWWAIAVCLLVFSGYLHAISQQKQSIQKMHHSLAAISQQKENIVKENQHLHLKLASQNDPAWVEMILIRELGVVPEGFLKVHFSK